MVHFVIFVIHEYAASIALFAVFFAFRFKDPELVISAVDNIAVPPIAIAAPTIFAAELPFIVIIPPPYANSMNKFKNFMISFFISLFLYAKLFR